MEISYLMLGSNLGDRMEYLRQGLDLLRRDAGRIAAVSPVYESEPWGFDCARQFLNQAVMLETDLAPAALLETIQRVEQALGRIRTQSGYLPRTLDVDIILFGNLVIDLPGLSIPHPLMAERMFVLQPLAELAPDLKHPVSHLTIACLRDRCSDKLQVRLFSNG